MLTEALIYLVANKAIIVGTAAVVSELIVIVYNLRRRLKKIRKTTVAEPSCMPQKEIVEMKDLLWSANPINIFKKA